MSSPSALQVDISVPGWGARLESAVNNGRLSLEAAAEVLTQHSDGLHGLSSKPHAAQLKKAKTTKEDDVPTPKDAVHFARRLGALKLVPRTGWVSRLNQNSPKTRVESVAEHSFRVGALGLLLQPALGPGLSEMGLLHDLAEAITGDIAPEHGISDADKHRMEREAMHAMREEQTTGSWFEQRVLGPWEAYEARQSEQAKAVKDLDRFEMAVQALEYEEDTDGAVDLEDFFNSVRGKLHHPAVQSWFQELERQRDELKKGWNRV
jgi:putative hydrolase of HD superfamily